MQTKIIILLFYSCVMLSLLLLRILYSPCYIEVSMNLKLERIQKKKFSKFFQIILWWTDKLDLFLSTNVLLFDVLTISIHHLCYASASSVKKINFIPKRKKILSQAAWFFSSYFMSDGHIYYLRGSLFIKVASQSI